MLKPTQKQQDGRKAEQLALHYLQQQGLRKVASNYHCRHGEIDLIMRDAGALVFVEVRYRRSSYHGTALDTITMAKQRRLQQAASNYLSRNTHWMNQPCRFDVICIDGKLEPTSIQWIRNAITE